MARVPYKNAVQVINDLAEPRIHAFVAAYVIMRPQVQAGKVKLIAMTNRQHAKILPDVPTATEAGYKSLEFDGLNGILRPRDIPKPSATASRPMCGRPWPIPTWIRNSAPLDRFSIPAPLPSSPR